MSKTTAGLSFQEAFEQSLAEEEVAASSSLSPANEELETIVPSEVEQPAVETEAEVGLFDDLRPEIDLEEQPDEGLHEVVVDGERKMVTLHELIAGYQRQDHYTQGRQELAELRKQYDNAITLWEALESDYVGTVQKLMARKAMSGQTHQIAPKNEPDIRELIQESIKEALASDPRLQVVEQEASLRQLNTIFDEIEHEFDITLKNTDRHAVLERAQREGVTNLRMVVATMLQEKSKIDAQRRNLELVSTVNGRRSGATQDHAGTTERYSTVTEAWEAALAEQEGNF